MLGPLRWRSQKAVRDQSVKSPPPFFRDYLLPRCGQRGFGLLPDEMTQRQQLLVGQVPESRHSGGCRPRRRRQHRRSLERERDEATRLRAVLPTVRGGERAPKRGRGSAPADEQRHVLASSHRIRDWRSGNAGAGVEAPAQSIADSPGTRQFPRTKTPHT